MQDTQEKTLIKKILKKTLAASAALLPFLGLISGCSEARIEETKIEEATLRKLYSKPLIKTDKKLKVYHLGHSLVGRTMPIMLQQLAGSGHEFRSQIGWGTTLKAHWEPSESINGFEKENDHENYQDVFEAIKQSQFDAFVLTEMVEIKDAIQYFNSPLYLQKFSEEIRQHKPDARVYIYESWHEITDKASWINRLDQDYKPYWLNRIVDAAHLKMNKDNPIHIIPVGQVMSAFFKEVERLGGIEGIRKPEDIFKRNPDGSLDPIHINDIGVYLVALVHYSVLYQVSPVGLPYLLKTETGDAAVSPSKEAAQLMQEITWSIVSKDYRTGIVGY